MKTTKVKSAADEAYTERNRLVALLAHLMPMSGIRKTDIPGWDPEWHNCVYVDTSCGQLSWHYHDDDSHFFADLPPYEKPWDGHTTEEKHTRLDSLTRMLVDPPDLRMADHEGQ